MLKEHGEEFEDMDEDTFDLIGAIGNMTQLKMVKDKCKKEDGGYNMCKGMDDWLKRRETEGAHNKLREIVEKKLNRGKAVEEIADALEEDVQTILTIINEIREYQMSAK